jgi:hypothetical protein
LDDHVDSLIESLTIGGDLLELNDVATPDMEARGTWIFPSLPSFVVRTSGSVYVMGIVPDHDTFLPKSLAQRIVYRGFTREIIPSENEDLSSELRELGLQQIPETVWLKSPSKQSAKELLSDMKRRLESQPRGGAGEDFEILDPEQPVTYYSGRWMEPRGQTGDFVARRPQQYGSPIWCFAALEGGIPSKFVDLPLRGYRWRGCDAAWHIQMAIDQSRNTPQLYKRSLEGDGVRLDFFSPLPQWSQRRLLVLGSAVPRNKCLMSFLLPLSEAQAEELFLAEYLWLERTKDSD